MKILRNFLFGLAAFALGACDDSEEPAVQTDSYFSFGNFYSMCAGDCTRIFIIQDGKLYQDKNDKFPKLKLDLNDYEQLSDEKYQLVKDLMNDIPDQLLVESDTIIGCPDCADGGGTYIELNSANTKRYWYLDNNPRYTPEYMHEFVVEVNDKITGLR